MNRSGTMGQWLNLRLDSQRYPRKHLHHLWMLVILSNGNYYTQPSQLSELSFLTLKGLFSFKTKFWRCTGDRTQRSTTRRDDLRVDWRGHHQTRSDDDRGEETSRDRVSLPEPKGGSTRTLRSWFEFWRSVVWLFTTRPLGLVGFSFKGFMSITTITQGLLCRVV